MEPASLLSFALRVKAMMVLRGLARRMESRPSSDLFLAAACIICYADFKIEKIINIGRDHSGRTGAETRRAC